MTAEPAPTVEYAVALSGGSMQLFPTDPETEEVYPLAARIERARRFGRVYVRTVVVVEDWHEVPRAAD